MTRRASGRSGSTGFALLAFAAAAVVLTWPLAASSTQAISTRGDYFVNLWNFWWVKTALFERGVSPYATDVLHHPLGISLARHTLSIVNALPAAGLSLWLDPHVVFKLLVGIHFWLSGFCFFLFARELTRCSAGSLLAGLLWSFCPFHFYYLAQLNLGTMEFLPLAGLFMVRVYRAGGVANTIGVALSAGLLAASSEYYLVYAGFLGALLALGGRWWDPESEWITGVRRLAVAGVAAGLVVVLVAWPLLSAALSGGAPAAPTPRVGGLGDLEHVAKRSNDLLGFLWKGAPEQVTVSWPTMLGYGCLALLAVGARSLAKQSFWSVLALAFFVLGLGPTLSIAGEDTGISLPYGWIAELPVLSMLRKPDRFIVMVQLAVCVLAAFAWRDVSVRWSAAHRRWIWLVVALALVVERAAVPLRTFSLEASPYLQTLGADGEMRALVDLPPFGGDSKDARANYYQTLHGANIAQGYVTSLALGEEHEAASAAWKRAYSALGRGDGRAVAKRAELAEVDLVVLHKTVPTVRAPRAIDGRVIWSPFVSVADELVAIRQLGHLEDRPVPASTLSRQRGALVTAFGEPVHEDEWIVAFAVK